MKEIENKENAAAEENTAQAGERVADRADAQTAEGKMKYGKFADAEGLLAAYENLEREFTRRSQRLKELEKALARDNEDSPRAAQTDETSGGGQAAAGNPDVSPEEETLDGFLEKYVYSNKDITREVMRRYIDGLSRNEAPSVINGRSGKMSLTPPKKPRSIKEASRLAEKFFEK